MPVDLLPVSSFMKTGLLRAPQRFGLIRSSPNTNILFLDTADKNLGDFWRGVYQVGVSTIFSKRCGIYLTGTPMFSDSAWTASAQ